MCAHIQHILHREVRHAHHLAVSSRPERQSEDSSKLISIYDDAEVSQLFSHTVPSFPFISHKMGSKSWNDGTTRWEIPENTQIIGRYWEISGGIPGISPNQWINHLGVHLGKPSRFHKNPTQKTPRLLWWASRLRLAVDFALVQERPAPRMTFNDERLPSGYLT